MSEQHLLLKIFRLLIKQRKLDTGFLNKTDAQKGKQIFLYSEFSSKHLKNNVILIDTAITQINNTQQRVIKKNGFYLLLCCLHFSLTWSQSHVSFWLE